MEQVIRFNPGFKHVLGVIPVREKLFGAADHSHSAARTGIYSHSKAGGGVWSRCFTQLLCWAGYL